MTSIYDYRLIYTNESWAWFAPELPLVENKALPLSIEVTASNGPGEVFKLAWDGTRLYSFQDQHPAFMAVTAEELVEGQFPLLRNWWQGKYDKECLEGPWGIMYGTRMADFIRMIESERSGTIYYSDEVRDIMEDYHGEVEEWLEDVHGYTIKGV